MRGSRIHEMRNRVARHVQARICGGPGWELPRSTRPVLVWTMSPNTICYHNLLGDDLPTMEDRLIRAEACDDETEYNLMVLGSRIALNLCMLATFRLTELSPLPPRVQRHRRLRDQRLNRLAARHCQEVLFKDLVIRDRPHRGVPTGDRGPPGRAAPPGALETGGLWREVLATEVVVDQRLLDTQG